MYISATWSAFQTFTNVQRDHTTASALTSKSHELGNK